VCVNEETTAVKVKGQISDGPIAKNKNIC